MAGKKIQSFLGRLAPKTKSKPFLSRFLYQILEQNWIDINNLFTDISDIFDNNPPKKLPWLLVHTRTRLGWAWSGLETKNFSIQERKTSKSFYHGVIVFHEQMKPHVDRSK
jgi:hypothetical protein